MSGPLGELRVRLVGVNAPESGECFSEEATDALAELVAAKDLVLVADRSDDARADLYADLQRDAQRAGRGLWAQDACGTSNLDGVEIVIDVNADAPGDDGVNLNGEWVTFTNAGAETIDLDGWEVADESASHRYTFDDLGLAPGVEVTLYSGCGRDDEATRHWCVSGSAVWNNSGDTVFLRDRNGNIVASLSYGDSG